MKTFRRLFSLLIVSTVLFASCSEKENVFTIIGEWGMVSGTIADGDGTTDRYEELPNGEFYQILQYKTDGTLIRTTLPDNKKSYGTYTFNSTTNALSYKYDGDRYYAPAEVQVIDYDEMVITTDYGINIGRITQYCIRLD